MTTATTQQAPAPVSPSKGSQTAQQPPHRFADWAAI